MSSLRRIVIPFIDRKIGRTTTMVVEKTTMTHLYISRVDVDQQWIVVSNPTNQTIDMTHYTVSNETVDEIFHFPTGYVLMPGSEVKIWCSAAEIGAEYFPIQQLLDPYLVWTDESTGKLRSRDFFHLSNQTALLLDASCDEGTVPYSIQHDWPLPHLCCLVASLTVSTDDQVTYSVSEDPVSSQQPLSFYIFSRYWNVASSTRAEMLFACVSCLSLFIAPVIETIRVLCAYRLWQVALYQPEEVLPVLLLAQVCDFASRSMCLHLRNRSAAILLTRIAVLVDMYWGSSLLLTLDRYHGRLNMVFITVLLIDILSIWLRICALVLVRRKTIAHAPFEVALQRMYLRHPYWICLCTFGKEVSLILICLLTIWPPSAWSIFYSIDLVRIFVCLCTSTLCLSTTLSALHALAAGCTIFYY